MDLNIQKCKKMHIGSKSSNYPYTMFDKFGTYTLMETETEKDLGVYFQNDLKWAAQIRNCCSRANRIVGMISKNFKYLDEIIVRNLYTGLVRPHIEYAIWAWNPTLEKDKRELEKIQRRATKLVPKLRSMEYEVRLKALNLTNLEIRRRRGDLIQFYKLLNGQDEIELLNDVKFRSDKYNLRGHSKRVTRELVKKCSIRQNFLTNRVANDWNNLPQHVIEAKSLNSFKAKLDKWFESKAIGLAKLL